MKKTLIALMALAGVAMGAPTAQQFKNSMQDAITLSGYQAGVAFSLSFTIADSSAIDPKYSATMLELASGWGIFTQGGAYIAMENTAVNDRGWVSPTERDTDTKTFTWTSTDATLLDSWVSLQPNGSTGGQPGIANLGVDINVTSAGSVITLTMASGVTAIIETAYVIKANDIQYGSSLLSQAYGNVDNVKQIFNMADGGTVTMGGVSYAIIPEPATATLSLLALAGLAARRRRK